MNKINQQILIIGLGNINSTPDALGPKTIDDLVITRHLYLLNFSITVGNSIVNIFVRKFANCS